jgi:hypothetical protein
MPDYGSYDSYENCDFSTLMTRNILEQETKTFDDVYIVEDSGVKCEVVFVCKDGTKYVLLHFQDCCECVVLDDVCGDLEDLLDSPILIAEERSHKPVTPQYESETYTFYEIATIKGSVTFKFHGSSNGYYSEEVSCIRVLTNLH